MTTTIAHVRRFANEGLNCAQVLLGAATIVALFWVVVGMGTFVGVAVVASASPLLPPTRASRRSGVRGEQDGASAAGT